MTRAFTHSHGGLFWHERFMSDAEVADHKRLILRDLNASLRIGDWRSAAADAEYYLEILAAEKAQAAHREPQRRTA